MACGYVKDLVTTQMEEEVLDQGSPSNILDDSG